MYCPNCRTAVPAGSRFCNACGAVLSAPGPAPAAPPPGHPPVSEQTIQYARQQPGYAPSTLPTTAARKPIALLSALVLVVILAMAAGGAALLRSRRSGATVLGSAQTPAEPSAGVQQAVGGVSPAGPGVLAGQGPAPEPAPSVAGAKGAEPDVPPSPLMAQGPGATPAGPAVIAGQAGPAIPGPSSMYAPAPRPPASPPVTGAPAAVQPLRPPVQSAVPQAPAPRDNRDFDAYLRWLRYVENERQGLRAQGETESFRLIEAFYQNALNMADPDAVDGQFDRHLQVTLNNTVRAIQLFRNNVLRTKPRVPVDCQQLDRYYMDALRQEGDTTAGLFHAMATKDIGRIKMLGRQGVAGIDRNLRNANRELEKVYRGRDLNPDFAIEAGGNSSLLGGMMGLGM